jgi:hypothetical protein
MEQLALMQLLVLLLVLVSALRSGWCRGLVQIIECAKVRLVQVREVICWSR